MDIEDFYDCNVFGTHQKMYSPPYNTPQEFDHRFHVVFIEQCEVRKALIDMYSELCSETPNLKKIINCMNYVADEFKFHFDEENLKVKTPSPKGEGF